MKPRDRRYRARRLPCGAIIPSKVTALQWAPMTPAKGFSLVALVLAAVACGGAPTQAQKESLAAKADADGVQRIRISAGSYFFKPNHIVVKVNVPVELVASREPGMTPHDL